MNYRAHDEELNRYCGIQTKLKTTAENKLFEKCIEFQK